MLVAAGTAKADDWQACIANQSDQLLAACSAVIEQRARNPAELSRAYTQRGEWYRLHSRFDEALADIEQAEKLTPNGYGAIVAHGTVLMDKGQLAEALGYYERAIASNPKNSFGYLIRGRLRQRQNQLTEAMADFDQAISLSGDNANYYINRGMLFSQIGDLDHAMSTGKKANSIVRRRT
jgi:tetratricopeptide (TPR) repeat protein